MKSVLFFEKFKTRAELNAWIKDHVPDAGPNWICENMPKESKFQEVIMNKLGEAKSAGVIDRNAVIWKEGSGVYQTSGLPDVCVIAHGKIFGFEVKRPFEVGAMTALQKEMQRRFRAAGAVYEQVSFWREVREIMRAAGEWRDA